VTRHNSFCGKPVKRVDEFWRFSRFIDTLSQRAMDHNGYSVGAGALQGIEGADRRKLSKGFMVVAGFSVRGVGASGPA
jgi:hypothetical protein